MMPEMNGIDLAIAVKSIHRECKILLFSGQSATADLLENARKLGHDFELPKTVHPADPLAKLRN
jgi:DNA-binding NarL/FixJ family response regulator